MQSSMNRGYGNDCHALLMRKIRCLRAHAKLELAGRRGEKARAVYMAILAGLSGDAIHQQYRRIFGTDEVHFNLPEHLAKGAARVRQKKYRFASLNVARAFFGDKNIIRDRGPHGFDATVKGRTWHISPESHYRARGAAIANLRPPAHNNQRRQPL